MTGSLTRSTDAESHTDGTTAGDQLRSVPPNQPPRTPEHNAFLADTSLRYWLNAFAPGAEQAYQDVLVGFGEHAGSWRIQDAADTANRNDPKLRCFERTGIRIDEIDFDPSWHVVMESATRSGVCGLPWNAPDQGYVVRGVGADLLGRIDIGVMCPVTMTTGAIAAIRKTSTDEPWEQRLRDFEGGQLLAGMAMTEPQGGSDLADTSSVAVEQSDGTFSISGHKWFCSYPVADVWLLLARESELGPGSRGLSCFIVDGWLPDGTRNGIELLRLKEKLGTQSLPSAEVMLNNAIGRRLGEPGAGVRTIIEMVVHTRMDCALGSAGVMGRAVSEAVTYAHDRRAFGETLAQQPLMRAVLADMALEREGAVALSMEVARTFQAEDPVRRLVTAFAKYWITRRAVMVAVEAVEALGGNGYTEEWPLARLYRDAQVNSSWEGSGNVIALDILRTLSREPELAVRWRERIEQLLSSAPTDLAGIIGDFVTALPIPSEQHHARTFAGSIAVATQAALLAWRAGDTGSSDDALVARAFVDTRLAGHSERVFGDGPESLVAAADVLLPRYRVS